jgi:hypothetical protein
MAMMFGMPSVSSSSMDPVHHLRALVVNRRNGGDRINIYPETSNCHPALASAARGIARVYNAFATAVMADCAGPFRR